MVRLRIGVLVAATSILFAACGTSASPSPAESGTAASAPAASEPAASGPAPSESAASNVKEGGTLIVAIPGDINRTDPALIDDSNSSYVEQQALEGLVTVKPGTTGEIVPSLAESWTVSPDGLTYTFKIRQGVKFHDGTDLDAAAVKFNYDRWINIPASYSDLGYTYYIDTVIGRGKDSNVASTAAPDPTTFILTLKAPNSAFLLTQTIAAVFAISSPKALTDGNASAPDFKDNKYAQGGPPAMVGTGPFMFKEWVPGDHVTLVKNPNYWNAAAGGPYLDGITFKVIADSTATLNALQSGDIDFSQILSPVDGTTAATDPNLQAIDRGGSCNAFILAMNQSHKPFDNPKIREAVAYAVNKQALIDAFYSGQAALPTTWAPPNTVFAKDENLPTYDPEKAKALIKESGVTNLSFDFWYPSDVARPYMPDPKGEFEAMLRDLEAVGFKPNPKTSTWRPDYLAAESTGKYPMWLIGWTCDWQGIDNFVNAAWFGYRTTGGKYGPNPEFDYKNDDMNQAILDALAAADDATAQAAWAKAQDLIRADMPAVPLLSSKPPAAAQTYVKGFVPAGNLTESFRNVWLDK